nr:unnamed protein product [Haemonchus contortus]
MIGAEAVLNVTNLVAPFAASILFWLRRELKIFLKVHQLTLLLKPILKSHMGMEFVQNLPKEKTMFLSGSAQNPRIATQGENKVSHEDQVEVSQCFGAENPSILRELDRKYLSHMDNEQARQ